MVLELKKTGFESSKGPWSLCVAQLTAHFTFLMPSKRNAVRSQVLLPLDRVQAASCHSPAALQLWERWVLLAKPPLVNACFGNTTLCRNIPTPQRPIILPPAGLASVLVAVRHLDVQPALTAAPPRLQHKCDGNGRHERLQHTQTCTSDKTKCGAAQCVPATPEQLPHRPAHTEPGLHAPVHM